MADHERIRTLIQAYANGDRGGVDELQRLGVLDGAPAWPAGDYARYLVAERLRARKTSERTVVVDGDERRLQVRGRHEKSYRSPSFFPVEFDPTHSDFDALVVVRFAIDFDVEDACLVPWGHLERLAVRYEGTGYRLRIGGPWREDPAVQGLDL